MRSRWVMALAALGMSGTVMAWEPANVDYSADQTMETAEMTMAGPVYVSKDKERREMLIEGTRQISIIRHDKKLMWTLMPEQRMYMEANLQASKDKTDLSEYQIEQTAMGDEVLNGVKTTKSKIVMTGKDGAKMGGFWWMSKEGVLVKMDVIAVDKNSKARIKTELKNLKIAKQDPALFEIPEGYERMGMMNMLMKGAEPGKSGTADEAKAPAEKPTEKKEKSGFGFKNIIDLVK